MALDKKTIDEKTDVRNVSNDALDYPGVAIDVADDEHVSEELVKERTATLNCNPRNQK